VVQDVREQYAQWGGDATSYKGVKIDLNGANRLFTHHYAEVRPVLTAIVDYRGYRPHSCSTSSSSSPLLLTLWHGERVL
jgi:hypothetical protein